MRSLLFVCLSSVIVNFGIFQPSPHIRPYPPARGSSGNDSSEDDGQSQSQPNQWWRRGDAVANSDNDTSSEESGSVGSFRRGDLRQHIQANQNNIKGNILHAFKAYIPQTTADDLCSLSADDRECLSNSQRSLAILWLAGAPNVNDPTSWLDTLNETCGNENVSRVLSDWQTQSNEQQAQAQAQWNENFSQLPASVQNIFTTFNTSFNNLRTNHQLFPPNQTAIHAALLQLVDQILAVPQSDLDSVVELYPNTSIILSADGELHGNFTILIDALQQYLTNGTVDTESLQEAQQAFRAYGLQQWEANKEQVGALAQSFQDAPESDVCPELLQEIVDQIDGKLSAVAAHAPPVSTSFLSANA